MSTVTSKDENLALSSEDSSSPEADSGLELGLGLSLSQPTPKNHHHHNHRHQGPYSRILTAKDFPSSPSSSSSSTPSSSRAAAGTKRTAADSVNNAPSQVVGWPPVRSYRMNSFNSQSKSPASDVFNSMSEKSKGKNDVLRKSAADNGNDDNNANIKEKRNLRSSLFVKVNMDGIGIGRKVDLSAHSSYKTLAQTLEDMFTESTTVTTCKGSNGEDHGIIVGGERHLKLLDGSSKFVLTYEDKEGDWMLVGDVPWGMFLSSVRRLRIMRTSEANGNGLAPRLEEKNCRQKSKPI